MKLIFICLFSSASLTAQVINSIKGVNYSQVEIDDNFWSPKITDVAKEGLAVCIHQTEFVTPRIKNFEAVAKQEVGTHGGIYYDDSDVYKAIEAMAYSLHSIPNPTIEAKADEWIDKIEAAQLPDGYLNTYYTLQELDNRWTDMEKHETYCGGHLIEAAIAYYRATGKRKLLDVAIRFANHMNATLRKAGKPWVAGHQEIELALIKLYRITGNEEYLNLSSWFLDQRGQGHGKGKIWDEWNDPAYCQDALPIREQTEITGHAVRAMYMYTGIADLAALSEDEDYLRTMETVWEDVVHRNTYVTGGIGSAGNNEGFNEDYVLPNENAYCETCASVGMVLWNQRMNWLTGDAKYMDVLERSLYNSALDGISLDGRQFFYPNPLKSHGQHHRKDWFGTACCPSNISRLITSIGNYIYAYSDDGIWVNLFIGSSYRHTTKSGELEIQIETQYPLDGKVKMNINASNPAETTLHLRVPGWVHGEVMDGDLYQFVQSSFKLPELQLNGKIVDYELEKGYALIKQNWQGKNELIWNIPMMVQKIKSSPSLKENRDKLALQYGPLVYCFEGADNENVLAMLLSENAQFKVERTTINDEPINALLGELSTLRIQEDGMSISIAPKEVKAIPYYTWCNRGSNDMLVWVPSRIHQLEIH